MMQNSTAQSVMSQIFDKYPVILTRSVMEKAILWDFLESGGFYSKGGVYSK